MAMVAFAREGKVKTGLIRRTLRRLQSRHGNAEGWWKANFRCPVETHRSAEAAHTAGQILGFVGILIPFPSQGKIRVGTGK
jgi:hypothetical protein